MDKFHEKRKYFIEIEVIDEKSLIVYYPNNIFLGIKEEVVYYILGDENILIQSDEETDQIECDLSERRPAIFKTILDKAEDRDMSTELIEGVHLIYYLSEPESQEDKEKEIIMFDYINTIYMKEENG